MPSKRFPGVNVGQVNFNERDLNCREGISKCNTGMGKSPGIDDDPRNFLLFCGMYALYESALMVTLKHIKRGVPTPSDHTKPLVDRIERVSSVYPRFTRTQEIQIGPVNDQYSPTSMERG